MGRADRNLKENACIAGGFAPIQSRPSRTARDKKPGAGAGGTSPLSRIDTEQSADNRFLRRCPRRCTDDPRLTSLPVRGIQKRDSRNRTFGAGNARWTRKNLVDRGKSVIGPGLEAQIEMVGEPMGRLGALSRIAHHGPIQDGRTARR